MTPKLFLCLLPAVLLSSCSLYPLGGDASYGSYFGAQTMGGTVAKATYVPKSVQRQEPILSRDVTSGRGNGFWYRG